MTSLELHDRVVGIFPEFAPYWHASDNVFREDNGEYAACGVFAHLSHFIRERFPSLPPSALSALGVFIDECLASTDTELADAAATCFLENLIAEPFTPAFTEHLGPRGKECIRELKGRAV
jgi:hypothetical protein